MKTKYLQAAAVACLMISNVTVLADSGDIALSQAQQVAAVKEINEKVTDAEDITIEEVSGETEEPEITEVNVQEINIQEITVEEGIVNEETGEFITNEELEAQKEEEMNTGMADSFQTAVTPVNSDTPTAATLEKYPNADSTISEEDLRDICLRAGQEFGISPYILYAMAERESSRHVYSVSGAGCEGLFQISPKWHAGRMEALGVTDIYDPLGNARTAASYMSELLAEGNGDYYYALMRYNMKASTANALYAAGEISEYAQGIVDRAHDLEGTF